MQHYNRAESFMISGQHLDKGNGCIKGHLWALDN